MPCLCWPWMSLVQCWAHGRLHLPSKLVQEIGTEWMNVCMNLPLYFTASKMHIFQSFVAVQSRPTLFDPIGYSTPGSPVLHYLPEFAGSCLLNQWCYLTISSSAASSSFCLQSFPAQGSFPRSQFFTSGGQSIGASASASSFQWIQDWFPLGWTG